jgi:hypothetical protein
MKSIKAQKPTLFAMPCFAIVNKNPQNIAMLDLEVFCRNIPVPVPYYQRNKVK